VVIGVGGYASGPAMMAAILLRVPTLAFEPNAVPGLANRLVGRLVSAAAVNFDETRRYFHGARVTGIPVRQEFFAIGAKRMGEVKRLLVFGGSQGARVLNEMMPKIAGRLLNEIPGLTVVHQTGGRHGESTKEAYERADVELERITVTPYLDAMVKQFRDADLVLCRSGASTVAELAAAGRPAVLVPFPQAADDHQRKNADAFVAAGAAVLMVEAELTADRLLHTLHDLLRDERRMNTMGERARRLAHPNAVRVIGEIVAGLANVRATN
jgi:UDP-N-acetylglucosamine--N-acetylmuramyl-(pentapeptide) pyrophosphoryl-undecaprenol N-acetylglucosamine transferase